MLGNRLSRSHGGDEVAVAAGLPLDVRLHAHLALPRLERRVELAPVPAADTPDGPPSESESAQGAGVSGRRPVARIMSRMLGAISVMIE